MNTRKTKWLGAALIALAGLAGRAGATNTSSYLNIDVTFSNALSVAVDGANTSSYTVAWTSSNQELLSPSTATVSNDSIQTERWKLFTNANSMNDGGAGTWALAASTSSVGADKFSLQAVFGSSNTTGGCGAATDAGTWNELGAPLLTTTFATGIQYTSAGVLASTELQTNGTDLPDAATNLGSMFGGSKRALCWRVIAPQSTTVTGSEQVIQVIVGAF